MRSGRELARLPPQPPAPSCPTGTAPSSSVMPMCSQDYGGGGTLEAWSAGPQPRMQRATGMKLSGAPHAPKAKGPATGSSDVIPGQRRQPRLGTC